MTNANNMQYMQYNLYHL